MQRCCPPYLYSRQRLFEFGFQWLKKWVWFFLPLRDTVCLPLKELSVQRVRLWFVRILQLWHSFSFWFEGIHTARYSGADGCVPKTCDWGLGFRKLLPLEQHLLQQCCSCAGCSDLIELVLSYFLPSVIFFFSGCRSPPLWLPNWRISPSSFFFSFKDPCQKLLTMSFLQCTWDDQTCTQMHSENLCM